MVSNEDILKKAKMWIEIAEEDLRVAKHSFTLVSNVPYRIICYHAQQCAEKFKGLFGFSSDGFSLHT